MRPIYEYPNDSDKTMKDALESIWRMYLINKCYLEIDIQGMGATLEQYHIYRSSFIKGMLQVHGNAGVPELRITSKVEFIEKFLPWADSFAKRFSDSKDFCFAIYKK